MKYSTLNASPIHSSVIVSGCSVTRNDTEYSYRVSMTWKDIPARGDVEYICYAGRKDDIMDERREHIRVHGK
jgi:hypothetical protein